jgi:hypothetical protein
VRKQHDNQITEAIMITKPDPGVRETITVQDWRYAGGGHRHGEPLWLSRLGSAPETVVALILAARNS